MTRDVRKIAARYQRIYETRDPFVIAHYLHIELIEGDLGSREGCYMYLKKHKCIFLNENLEEHERYFVMAHELGHAIMHPKMNCYFIRNKTLLLTSRVEREANKFAVELLIGNDFLHENKDLTVDQLARLTGYCKDFIELRLEE